MFSGISFPLVPSAESKQLSKTERFKRLGMRVKSSGGSYSELVNELRILIDSSESWNLRNWKTAWTIRHIAGSNYGTELSFKLNKRLLSNETEAMLGLATGFVYTFVYTQAESLLIELERKFKIKKSDFFWEMGAIALFETVITPETISISEIVNLKLDSKPCTLTSDQQVIKKKYLASLDKFAEWAVEDSKDLDDEAIEEGGALELVESIQNGCQSLKEYIASYPSVLENPAFSDFICAYMLSATDNRDAEKFFVDECAQYAMSPRAKLFVQAYILEYSLNNKDYNRAIIEYDLLLSLCKSFHEIPHRVIHAIYYMYKQAYYEHSNQAIDNEKEILSKSTENHTDDMPPLLKGSELFKKTNKRHRDEDEMKQNKKVKINPVDMAIMQEYLLSKDLNNPFDQQYIYNYLVMASNSPLQYPQDTLLSAIKIGCKKWFVGKSVRDITAFLFDLVGKINQQSELVCSLVTLATADDLTSLLVTNEGKTVFLSGVDEHYKNLLKFIKPDNSHLMEICASIINLSHFILKNNGIVSQQELSDYLRVKFINVLDHWFVADIKNKHAYMTLIAGLCANEKGIAVHLQQVLQLLNSVLTLKSLNEIRLFQTPTQLKIAKLNESCIRYTAPSGYPITLYPKLLDRLETMMFDMNVPADGHCLFYCMVFGYLLPVLEDDKQLNERIQNLGGEPGERMDKFIHYLKNNFAGNNELFKEAKYSIENEYLMTLIYALRKKTVAEMKGGNRERYFENFLISYPEQDQEKLQNATQEKKEALFENHLKGIEGKGWGLNIEIGALCDVLGVTIRTYKFQHGDVFDLKIQDNGKNALDPLSETICIITCANTHENDLRIHNEDERNTHYRLVVNPQHVLALTKYPDFTKQLAEKKAWLIGYAKKLPEKNKTQAEQKSGSSPII